MIAIIGLGNPESRYNKTKHNVGFRVIDKLSSDYNINMDRFKYKAFVGYGNINNKNVILVKPQTYMNLSGESVREIFNFYKLSSDEIIIIYDDIDLPIGSVRIREKGSSGGHNGIKNIIYNLNTDTFLRVRVGIGQKPNGIILADYVLSNFTDDEEIDLSYGIERAICGIETLLFKGVNEAMNKINQKLR